MGSCSPGCCSSSCRPPFSRLMKQNELSALLRYMAEAQAEGADKEFYMQKRRRHSHTRTQHTRTHNVTLLLLFLLIDLKREINRRSPVLMARQQLSPASVRRHGESELLTQGGEWEKQGATERERERDKGDREREREKLTASSCSQDEAADVARLLDSNDGDSLSSSVGFASASVAVAVAVAVINCNYNGKLNKLKRMRWQSRHRK